MNTRKRPRHRQPQVGRLIPTRNSRTHSDAQVAQIAASVREFGWTNPCWWTAKTGSLRGMAASWRRASWAWKKLPCIELAGLSDTQRRAYIIADNKLALNAGWDDELLAIEFSELSEAGYDLALTGFTQDEIDALVDCDSEPDAIAQDLSQKTRRQLQEMVTYGAGATHIGVRRQLGFQRGRCSATWNILTC